MQTLAWFTINKASWPAGPWKEEPDKMQWRDPLSQLPCLIIRNPQSGSLCGYVGVPKGHPSHSQHYNSLELEVHGGLTFSGERSHVSDLDEPDNTWWFGFDCAHLYDASPAREDSIHDFDARYRDWQYVTREVESLAKQLKELAA